LKGVVPGNGLRCGQWCDSSSSRLPASARSKIPRAMCLLFASPGRSQPPCSPTFSDRSAPQSWYLLRKKGRSLPVCPIPDGGTNGVPDRGVRFCLSVLPERAMRRAAAAPNYRGNSPRRRRLPIAAKHIPIKSRQFPLITNVLSLVAHVGFSEIFRSSAVDPLNLPCFRQRNRT
jgi:hypothetical protein